MSVCNLSVEAQTLTNSALQMAQGRKHEELDSSHLFYILIQESSVGQAWLKRAAKEKGDALLVELALIIDAWYPVPFEYSEPSASYLHALQAAEQKAVGEGSREVLPAHLLSAVLDQDQRLLEWLVERVMIPAEVGGSRKTILLDQVSRDLTQLACQKNLTQVIGREKEVEQLVEVLLRQGKNSALLIGPAGVGKTAIVERLAQEIINGTVPDTLKDRRLIELNISALLAGTSFRGEFEERMNMLLKELEINRDIILVVDEFHALAGAGLTSEGGPDAVSVLKPALARGDITLIGISTDEDFARYVESDSALVRRFNILRVTEPSLDETVEILTRILPRYIRHHQIQVEDGVVETLVKWAERYLPSRHFPDKAIDILGKSFARAELHGLELVSESLISNVISEAAGVPVGNLEEHLRETLVGLETRLAQTVIGQEEAVQALANAVRLSFAGLRDPRRPKGVFLFAGPSGVGKTELARTLANILFGSENALLRFDMSEYAERLNMSRLIGSAPGYVGYEEPGQLTQALRDHPYSVVLFDEVEKACPEVYDLFLQLFDEGRITDSHGRLTDGRNAFFIMTSNLTSKKGQDQNFGFISSIKKIAPEVNEQAVRAFFRPEFINRVDQIINFHTLEVDDLAEICALEMGKLTARMEEKSIRFSYERGALDLIAAEAARKDSGARAVKSVVENLVSAPLSAMLLQKQAQPGDWLHMEVNKNKISFVWM